MRAQITKLIKKFVHTTEAPNWKRKKKNGKF